MGREKNSIHKLKEMKLSFALAALASAAVEWDGQSPNGGCGSQISGDSLVNSTCTVTGNNIKTMYAGNGAFIVDSNQLTGFDGISVMLILSLSLNKIVKVELVTTLPAGMLKS